MTWTRLLTVCGLCLMGWEHDACVEVRLRVSWRAARAVRRALQGPADGEGFSMPDPSLPRL